MACNSGWDWGPVLTTVGIWREVRLEAWNAARIGDVRFQTHSATATQAKLTVDVDLSGELGQGETVSLTLLDPDSHESVATTTLPADRDLLDVAWEIEDPKRWWPCNYGEQPLYELVVELKSDSEDQAKQSVIKHVGIRQVELRRDPDPEPVEGFGQGSEMTLLVNDEPVFLKGANWIPDDCFPTRVTPEQYQQRLTQAVGSNMNTLRVWGGGIFEDELFYQLCDQMGIMVWQDFMFACAAYPEEQPYYDEVEAESRDNVSKLCSHPSIVIWNGCNENVWGTFDWGPDFVALRTENKHTWGAGYYFDLLPKIVEQYTPSVPYWPASPYSGTLDIHPNANEHGNRHVWDAWMFKGPYRCYLEQFPRMATEFGFHGGPTFATLDRSIPDTPEERRWDGPSMEAHNRAINNEYNTIRLKDDFSVPPLEAGAAFDDWLYLTQIMQARALDLGCTWFRALYPWCKAAVYWQINDCWPVVSWAAIDGDGRLKPLWYATRRFFADRVFAILPETPVKEDQPMPPLCLYVINDHEDAWIDTVTVSSVTMDGSVMDKQVLKIETPARSVTKIVLQDSLQNPQETLLVTDNEGAVATRGFWWALPDKELTMPEAQFEASLTKTAQGYAITITAETLLRDLCIFPDRLDPDASISEQWVTLLPGETMNFYVTTQQDTTLDQLTKAPVLQTANRFAKQ